MVHDAVGRGQWGILNGGMATIDDAHGVGVVAFQLHEGRLAHEVSSEEHAIANLVLIEVAHEFRAGEWSTFL